MELLKEIASVSGKGGLFKILKPTRTGVILETIDEKKTKLVANTNERVSILKEISIYTTGEESSKPLEDVLKAVHKLYGVDLKVSNKSSDAELRDFMEKVVPDYDAERVYCSDIKKLINWYSILTINFSDLFVEKKAEATPKTDKTEKVEEAVEEKPKKAVAPKAKASEKKAEAEEKPKKATAAKAAKK